MFRLLYRPLLIVCVLLLMGQQSALAQEPRLETLIPRQTRPLLDKAQKLINSRFAGPARLIAGKSNHQEFVDTLNEIGSQMNGDIAPDIAALEGTDIRAKLMTIAWDARRRPQIYREIEQEYVYLVVRPLVRAFSSHYLENKHATETYRLAWEYILLSPAFQTGVGQYDLRAEEALERIQNNASIVTLVTMFGTTTVEGTAEDSISGNEFIGSLSRFDNPQGLQGLLQCLSLAEAKQQKHPVKNPYAAPTVEVMHKYLTTENTPERIAHWRELIAAQPRKGLPSTHKQFLDSIAPAPQRL